MADAEEIKPNEKELRLFEKEKLDLYKGTFVVCIVYGLSAFILLAVILLTEWGKEYIYNRFAPAVITYILGSLVIILYLLNSIYSIKPRKVGTDMDSDENMRCPDFWRLEKVPANIKEDIINNNINNVDKKIIPEITRTGNNNLQYRCVYDKNVYGATRDLLKMKNVIKPGAAYKAGFETLSKATQYSGLATAADSSLDPNYIVAILNDKASPNYQDLKKYAKFSGIYSSNNANVVDSNITTASLKIGDAAYIKSGAETNKDVWDSYENNAPLICNVVYPKVLGILDEKTKEKNEVSCEYAKQCGISWSSLNCKK